MEGACSSAQSHGRVGYVVALAALKYSNPEEFSDTINGPPEKEHPRRSSKLLKTDGFSCPEGLQTSDVQAPSLKQKLAPFDGR